MYAIVRAGGRQEKVAVGDVFELDRVVASRATSVTLPALLLVDGEQVTSDADDAGRGRRSPPRSSSTTKGPKITILQVQEQDRLPQAPGSPPAAHRRSGSPASTSA